MKNIKKNNKGFTLIELLAVIVILAVLILLAMPQVMNLMEDARKNAFKTETQSILKSAENAFVTKTMSGEIKTLTISNTQYRYLCMNLADFKTEGLMDKDFAKNGYTGIVEVFVPSSGTATYGISISNGTYSFEYMTKDLLTDDAVQPGTNTKISLSCPTDATKTVKTPDCYNAAASSKASKCG